MKAWLVYDKEPYGAEIVFAETRGKARSLALSFDCCDDSCFTDVEVRRAPYADKYYKEGKVHLDWDNPIDRIVLVKECGFVCDYDYLEWEDCETCSAKDHCDRYKDHLFDKGGAEQSCNNCASQDKCEKATHHESYRIDGCMDFKDKKCPDCKHFVGCECFSGMTCSMYEEKKE